MAYVIELYIFSGLSALRVYGINGRHWGVPLLICAMFVPAMIETIVSSLRVGSLEPCHGGAQGVMIIQYECITTHGINDPPFGCDIYSIPSASLVLNRYAC